MYIIVVHLDGDTARVIQITNEYHNCQIGVGTQSNEGATNMGSIFNNPQPPAQQGMHFSLPCDPFDQL